MESCAAGTLTPTLPQICYTPPNSDVESLEGGSNARSPPARYAMLYPKKTSLGKRLRVTDHLFVDFVGKLLSVDPTLRYKKMRDFCLSCKGMYQQTIFARSQYQGLALVFVFCFKLLV